MIKVKNVSKNYGQRKAIDNISFDVKEGEVVGFLGPNGAGKTTTMKMLTGFMAPTSGSLLINGKEVFEDPIAVKSILGYLPETPPLYIDMTVRSYLSYVCELKGVASKDKKTRINEVAKDLKLDDVLGRMIKNLSKGYKQRVGIAQALVSKPKVLILDEPTSGLDPAQVAEFRGIINRLKGKHTIILSTHVLSEVQACCERVVIINQGQIVAEDSIEGLANLMAGSKNLILRLKKLNDSLIASLKDFDFVQAVSQEGPQRLLIQCDEGVSHLEQVAQKVIDSKLGLLEIRQEEIQLEKIFIQLTHKQEQTS